MVRWGACIALITAAVASYAATPKATSRPATATAPAAATSQPAPAATTQPAQQDPTRPSDKLRPFLTPLAGAATRPAEAKEPALPRIVKRAFLQLGGRPPEALVEIEGSSLISIRQGSTVTVTTRQGETVTIRITKLSADEITIEMPATGRKATIR
jgi:endonuclease YncB( thermonuclease family)